MCDNFGEHDSQLLIISMLTDSGRGDEGTRAHGAKSKDDSRELHDVMCGGDVDQK